MGIRQQRAGRLKRVGIVSALLGILSGGCSSPPPLREEELLKLLVEVARVGLHQFQQNTWPLLEKKTITYCGRADEVKVPPKSAGKNVQKAFSINNNGLSRDYTLSLIG